MKLDYNIYEEIGSDWGIGLSAQTFNEDTKELKAGDELVLHFNSPGGSVTEGIAMANRISALGKSGVKTTAIVEGICASIATVMMCACETVKMNRSAFCMIHNCWAVVQGDADELRKQADVMEKMNDAIMSFYRSKFDLTDDELRSYMDAETWFSGMEAADFKFKCEVIEDETDIKLAAKFDLTRFHKLPEVLNMTKTEEQANEPKVPVEDKAEETKEEETVVEEPEKTEEPDTEEPEETEEPDTEEPEEPDEVKELKARIAELEAENEELKKKCAELNASQSEATITKDEADKRVSGMQAKMQSQVNSLTSELTNFKIQLQAKEEELKSAKAEITSLNDSLTKSTEELSAMASTLAEKTKALEKLNANVNAQAEELPTMEEGLAKCASPADRVAFIKSGKYVH